LVNKAACFSTFLIYLLAFNFSTTGASTVLVVAKSFLLTPRLYTWLPKWLWLLYKWFLD